MKRTNGFVLLHRRIQKSDLWRFLKSKQIIVAEICVMNANWRDEVYMGLTVKRGQWLTHYHTIQECCPKDISIKEVRGTIGKLSSQEVAFLGTRSVMLSGLRYILITVNNYETYQPEILFDEKTGTWSGTRSGITWAQGGHNKGMTINEEVKEREESENNRRAPVDNSRKDRTGDIANLTSDLAEEKAINNIALVDQIIEETGDRESRAYYERIVRQVDHFVIQRMLGTVHETRNLGEIRKSPGAMLKHLIKLELKEVPDATT